jgi:ferredoxin
MRLGPSLDSMTRISDRCVSMLVSRVAWLLELSFGQRCIWDSSHCASCSSVCPLRDVVVYGFIMDKLIVVINLPNAPSLERRILVSSSSENLSESRFRRCPNGATRRADTNARKPATAKALDTRRKLRISLLVAF